MVGRKKTDGTRPTSNTNGGDQRIRGLLVNYVYARRFLEKKKTWELRSMNCRCVRPGETFYLLESGIGNNMHGVALFRIVALLKFVTQGELTWADVRTEESRSKHQCTDAELDSLRAMWKNRYYKGPIFWEVEVVEVLDQPLYIPCGHQARTKVSLVTHDCLALGIVL